MANRTLAPVTVTDVVVKTTQVRFRVDRVGVPVLVRISWFPNWNVEGGSGPYRAMPNYMVVIPTRNEVIVDFGRSTADHVGTFAVFGGIIGVFALRRKRREIAGAPVAASTTASQDRGANGESAEESASEPDVFPQS